MENLKEKIMSHILVTSKGCWEWQGAKTGAGYGNICIHYDPKIQKSKNGMVHRVVYEIMKEPIPKGKVLSHICNNPPCCNPNHMEPMSQKRNLNYMRALERHSNGKRHSEAIIAGHSAKLLPKPPSKRKRKRIYSHEELKRTITKNIIETTNGCWIWTKNGSHARYGKIHGGVDPKTGKPITLAVHRASYEIFKGEIPHGLQVCHTCDNKLCCNPDHLWLGTFQENTRDRNFKNRQSKGENHAAVRRLAAHKKRTKKAREAGYTPEHKYCPQCDQWLTRDKFTLNKSTYDGLYGFCRLCARTYKSKVQKQQTEQKKQQALEILMADAEKSGVPMDDLNNWKRCSRCQEWKLKIEFNKGPSKTDNLQFHCRKCTAIAWQQYANKHLRN